MIRQFLAAILLLAAGYAQAAYDGLPNRYKVSLNSDASRAHSLRTSISSCAET